MALGQESGSWLLFLTLEPGTPVKLLNLQASVSLLHLYTSHLSHVAGEQNERTESKGLWGVGQSWNQRIPEQMLASCVSYRTGTCKAFWTSVPGGGTSPKEGLHRKGHISYLASQGPHLEMWPNVGL